MIRPLVSALLLLAVAAPAAAQPAKGGRAPFIPPKDAKYELFRGLLHFHGIEPIGEDELVRLRDYSKVIVVILNCSDRQGTLGFDDGYTRKALANGGAVLIATDRGANLTTYFPRSGNGAMLATTGGELVPQAGVDCYLDQAAFPLLRPQNVTEAPLTDLFARRPRIAANVPTVLVRDGLHAVVPHAVALTPPTRGNERGHLFAVGGVGGDRNPYRALVMADADLLSNQMLYSSGLPDRTGQGTDNWTFANALVKDFLREPNGRNRCLFVENGNVISKFDDVELKSVQQMQSIPPIPLPNPLDRRVQAKLADVIDTGLAKFEDSPLAHQLLTGPPNDPTHRRFPIVMAVLASAAAVALVVLMARRVQAARHRKNFVPAPTDPLFLGDEVALGSFGQRRAELLRGTDFHEPVVHRIRSLFALRGLPAEYARRRLPPIEFRGRSDRARLGGDIRDLWEVVTRDADGPLSYAEWKELEPVLAEVHAAAAADRWRFAQTSPQGSA